MRKVLFLVALVLITAPAMGAVTIDVNTTGEPENVARIDYSVDSGTYPRAFALDISVDAGTITDVYDYWKEGESVGGVDANGTAKAYGIFPGNIQIDTSGTVTDYGSPVAPSSAPDSPGQIGSSSITLEMGSLYVGASNAPPDSGTLCRVELSGGANLTVAEDTTRGGVVLEDTTGAATNLPVTTQVGDTGCFDTGHADYTEWQNMGEPESWCYQYQCYGDADGAAEDFGKGTVQVGYDDLDILLSGWRTQYSGDPATDPWIAADFNRAEEDFGKGTVRVGYDDLDILLSNWRDDSGLASNCGGDL